MSHLDALLLHPLFEGVEASHVAACGEAISVSDVSRGTLLNTPMGARGRLHAVLRGTLRAYQVTADGRELLLELIPEGGIDGLLSMDGRRGHFTEAQVDSTVASMDRSTVNRLIAADSTFAVNLLQKFMDRLEGREHQLESVVLHDPDLQLARQLLALGHTVGRKHGAHVLLDPRITHQMLADMLGVRRETVTLHLSRLVQRRAVNVVGGRFELDAGALQSIVNSLGRGSAPGRVSGSSIASSR